MTKAPTPAEKSKKQRNNTKTPPKTSITQRLRTDLGTVSLSNDSHPTDVVKPVLEDPNPSTNYISKFKKSRICLQWYALCIPRKNPTVSKVCKLKIFLQ